jgi:hypothetical protein
MVQDYSIENGPLIMAFNAETEDASTLWGTGPGTGTTWIEDPVEAGDHWLFNITSTPPPTASCGAVLLT